MYFVLETWIDRDGQEKSGQYQFVLVTCDPRDESCDESL
jgi:hypothetical protein